MYAVTLRFKVAALLLMSTSIASAEGVSQRPILRIDGIDAAHPPLLRLFVTELDAARQVKTLGPAANYRLSINALPEQTQAQVQSFVDSGEPLALVLVVQLSPGISAVFRDVIAQTGQLIHWLPQESVVGIIGYADAIVDHVKPTTVAEAEQTLGKLAIRDDALENNIPFAIQEAIDDLKQVKPTRRVIVVISDGITADLNPRTFSQLARTARNEQIQIHTIGYSPLEPAGLRTLYQLSGGVREEGTFRATTTDLELRQSFLSLREELRQQRILTFDLPHIFRGEVADCQIDVGGVSSEPMEVELVKWTGGRASKFFTSPWTITVLIVILVVGGTAAGNSLWHLRARRNAAIAHTITKPTEPKPDESKEKEDAAPAFSWKFPTAPTTTDSPVSNAVTVTSTEPATAQSPHPADTIAFAPTLPAAAISFPPFSPPVSNNAANALPVLPSPDEFLRRMRDQQSAPASTSVAAEITPAQPTIPAPTLNVAPPTIPMGLVSAATPTERDPLLAPVAPAAFQPYAFDRRKTEIISVDELDRAEELAWIAALEPAAPETRQLHDGFEVERAIFRRSAEGQWSISDPQSMSNTPLADNTIVRLGSRRWIFKQVDRTGYDAPSAQSFLDIVGGMDDGRRIPLRTDALLTIGSDPSCSVMVRGEGVCPRHVLICLRKNAVHVADLGAETGVRIGGRSVGSALLNPSEEVAVGAIRLIFRTLPVQQQGVA